MKKAFWVLVLIFFQVCMLFAQSAKETQPALLRSPLDPNDTFVIALEATGEMLQFDPAFANDANSLLILDGLFEGLFRYDPKTAEPVPALAQQTQVSADGRRWTFTIRPSARFSNGDPITAQTFIDSWMYLIKSKSNMYMVSLLDIIKGVQAYREGNAPLEDIAIHAPTPTTLEIELVSHAPYLPAMLCNVVFSAVHPAMRTGQESRPLVEMITSGPFVIKKADEHSVILGKNNWYWDYDAVASDYIEVRFVDPDKLIQSYLDRTIHWSLGYIPPQVLRHPEDLSISFEYSTGFYYFSAQDGPYADPRVRKALSLLIPWDTVRLMSRQVFHATHLVPDYEGKPAADVKTNRDLAFQLLNEAGYPNGEGLPPLSMAIHRGSQVEQTAHFIASQWSREIGMTVILDVVGLSVYTRDPAASPYDFAFITWIGDFYHPFSFLHLWTSDSTYNLGNYRNEEFDLMMQEAMESPTEQLRTTRMRQAEEHLLNEAVVFPVYHGIATNIIDTERVKGWFDNVLNIHPLKDLSIQK